MKLAPKVNLLWYKEEQQNYFKQEMDQYHIICHSGPIAYTKGGQPVALPSFLWLLQNYQKSC